MTHLSQDTTQDKEYSVTLDAFIMESVVVEAKNEKEAIEKAMDASQYPDHELSVYEVQESK